jgi:uncharacterized membrane protein YgdD (TMEM256/DUF423 family)/16S rRNA U1498 N3-methylase RsmE
MNLVLLEPGDLVDAARAIVRGRRLAHVREVHRAGVGDALRAGVVGGRMGTATVLRMDDESLELSLALADEPPPRLELTLVLALPRPKVLARVLQCVAAMGVKRLHLMNAWRVEKSFWRSPALRPERIRENLLLGLEQGCDTILPEVWQHPLLRPFVEDELPALSAGTIRLVADPRAAASFPRAVPHPVTSTLLAVAAVSGFIAVALGAFGAHGLRERLAPDLLAIFEVGVRYQMYHALALAAAALALERRPDSSPLQWAAWSFVAGTLVFSGSLYVLALSGVRWLGAVTPLGGVAFLAGWLLLAWGALRR